MIFTSYLKINNYSANTFTVTWAEISGWTIIVTECSPCSFIGPSGNWTSLLSISTLFTRKASDISLVPTDPYKAPSSVTGTNISHTDPSIDSDLDFALVKISSDIAASSSFLDSTSAIFFSLQKPPFFEVLKNFWRNQS